MTTRITHTCLAACAALMLALNLPAAESGAGVEKAGETNAARVGLFNEAALGVDAATVEALRIALRGAGAPARLMSADELCDTGIVNRAALDVLVLPMGTGYPIQAVGAIESFLRNGGGVIFLGVPPFSNPFWRIEGEWVDGDGYERKEKAAALKPDAPLKKLAIFDFAQGDPGGWSRASNDAGSPADMTIQKGGVDGKKDCLLYHVAKFTGWDIFGRAMRLPDGTAMLYIDAKGDARTPQFAIELNEQDGSRWIAVVNLTEKMEKHLLTAGDFKFWPGKTSDRGKPGDRVSFTRVNNMSIGLALSHTQIEPGEHKVWIQEIGATYAGMENMEPARELALDGISPQYKLFPVTSCASVCANPQQALVRNAALPAVTNLFSCVPRSQGTGIEKGRKARFVPLVQARDKDGNFAANAAWLFIDKGAAYRGSWACFGFNQKELYRDKALAGTVADLARRMQDGVFLYDGGSQYYVYFQGESVKLGAEVVNFGMQVSAPLTVRISVTSEGAKEAAYQKEFTIEASSGKSQSVSDTWNPGASTGRSYSVRTELVRDGKVVDVLAHELHVWEPKPLAKRSYITAKDGDLWLNGQKWRAHGVNYMPSCGVACDDWEYFHEYVGTRAYDPDIIDADLSRISRMGMNMVSVFVCFPHHRSRNVVDLLMRCEKYGLKVNLGLRHRADPMNFDWAEVKEMIESLRLAEHDSLFAYDLAWETHWGNYLGRFDAEWERWVVERYGSVANAEKDWGVPIPRNGNKVARPGDGQLGKDGEWRGMVAAYRRFADDFSSQKHGAAVRLIKSSDPHHLTSFRMGFAGNPVEQPNYPYDFRAFKSLDLIEPETYGGAYAGNPGQGSFAAAYARYAAPGRPVFWAELGVSIWDGSNFSGTPPKTKEQVSFYERMYDMILKSHSSGSAGWFWPGGYRFDEKSDYGVINPDGSWRPVSEVIKKYSAPMTAPRDRPAVDHWITIDRDADARGLVGIYARVQGEFWQAVQAGKFPGLRDEGTGMDSTNVPLKAVGNTDYNGNNPPKYLNAEFNYVRVKDADGKWVDVQNGVRIKVKAGAPVVCRASAGNTQSATWISPAKAKGVKGAVYLSTVPGTEVQSRGPITADTPCFADAEIPEFVLSQSVNKETKVILQMTAEGRAWFGEKVDVILTPIDKGSEDE
jgi:hypothetical protein